MSSDFRDQIYASMNQKETEELAEIWNSNDHLAWSELAFDVVQEILETRLGKPLSKGEPILGFSKQDDNNKPGDDGQKMDVQRKQFALFWLMANIVGLFIGVAAAAMLNATLWATAFQGDSIILNPIQRMATTGLCIGCWVGIAQWLAFRKLSPWWILASTIGWTAGLIVVEFTDFSYPYNFVGGALAGIIIGLSEWFVLRRFVPRSYWWIIAHLLIGLAALSLNMITPNLSIYDLIYGAILPIGVIIGIVTGITLKLLLRSSTAGSVAAAQAE